MYDNRPLIQYKEENIVNEEVKRIKKSTREHKKKSYPVLVENKFLRNPKYTVNQKIVYLCLQSYSDSTDNCFLSKHTVAQSLNLGIGSINKNLIELEELGALLIINQVTETNNKINNSNNLYILAEIDKSTGDFMPQKLSQLKYEMVCLSN